MNINAMQERQGLQGFETPPLERVIQQLSPPRAPRPGSKRTIAICHTERDPSLLPHSRSKISENPSSLKLVLNTTEGCYSTNIPRCPPRTFLKRRRLKVTGNLGERTNDEMRLAEDMPPPPFLRSQDGMIHAESPESSE
mmetsp:Transcript_31061/g.66109  ORF Transcript_31061/g.66109 Transcript_31061/m.66109 type:complete len:139 (-) Transcript_31061:98-514(-)